MFYIKVRGGRRGGYGSIDNIAATNTTSLIAIFFILPLPVVSDRRGRGSINSVTIRYTAQPLAIGADPRYAVTLLVKPLL